MLCAIDGAVLLTAESACPELHFVMALDRTPLNTELNLRILAAAFLAERPI